MLPRPQRSTRTATLLPYPTLVRSVYSGRALCEAISAISPAPKFSWTAPAWALRLGGKAGDVAGGLLRRPVPLNSEVVTRSEEHTSELPSLMRHSYAALCLTKNTIYHCRIDQNHV